MAPDATQLAFNKACEIEDFSHPDLIGVIRDVCRHKLPYFDPAYPVGAEYNKDWEVSMAVRTLREFGVLNRDSTILGVAAGKEDTIFYLTNYVKQVFATDRYLNALEWKTLAPIAMMIDPASIAPFGFEPNRLVVQHMDARRLQFPDNTFDGIFSSGSIEHFGELEEIAASAYEMGRVLKPGGTASISTIIKLAGPEGYGWPGMMVVMSKAQLMHFIVEPSGLELVDEFDTAVSEATLATSRNLTKVLEDREARFQVIGEMARVFDTVYWDMPHILLEHEGYLFDSVHLALRKPEKQMALGTWAATFPAIDESIRTYNLDLLEDGAAGAAPSSLAVEVDNRLSEVEFFHDRVGRIVARQTDENADKEPPVPRITIPADWVGYPIKLDAGIQFEILIDEAAGDPISELYRTGQGHLVNQDLIEIMLQLARPGDTIVDLGGFVGTFALAASAAGCKACVIEADPTNAALLRASAVRNGFRQMRVVEAAATDSFRTLEFYSHGPWGRVVDSQGTEPTARVVGLPVEVVLAELGWDRVAFVKIDVEGSEIDALKGMGGLLAPRNAPPMIIESNGHTLALRSSTPQELHRLLSGLGYTPYLIKPGRLIEVEAGQLQPNTVSNWLAVKGGPPSLPGYAVEGPMGTEELIRELVYEGTLPIEDHRAHVAGALARAASEIKGDQRIIELLESLRTDLAEAAHRKAGWSAGEPK